MCLCLYVHWLILSPSHMRRIWYQVLKYTKVELGIHLIEDDYGSTQLQNNHQNKKLKTYKSFTRRFMEVERRILIYNIKIFSLLNITFVNTQDNLQFSSSIIVINLGEIQFPSNLPTSCLLGCVDIVDVLPQEEYRELYPEGESNSPYVFICTNPQELLVKFPMQGQHKICKGEYYRLS